MDRFDAMIGRLDRTLSEMVMIGKRIKEEDKAKGIETHPDHYVENVNRQTLKHHAEDMILAGQKILRDIGFSEQESDLEIRVSRSRYRTMDNEALIREVKARGLAYPPVDDSPNALAILLVSRCKFLKMTPDEMCRIFSLAQVEVLGE